MEEEKMEKDDFDDDLKDFLKRNSLTKFTGAFSELGYETLESLRTFASARRFEKVFGKVVKKVGHCDAIRLAICKEFGYDFDEDAGSQSLNSSKTEQLPQQQVQYILQVVRNSDTSEFKTF